MVFIQSQFQIKKHISFSVHLPKLGDYCVRVAIDPATHVCPGSHAVKHQHQRDEFQIKMGGSQVGYVSQKKTKQISLVPRYLAAF